MSGDALRLLSILNRLIGMGELMRCFSRPGNVELGRHEGNVCISKLQ